MSNLEKASRLLQDFVFENGADVDMYYAAKDLLLADLLMPDVQVIRTPEELEALAREDADAVVLAGFIGVPRPACTLYEMCKAGQTWTLPATVIATGDQVHAAHEALEQDNG